MHKLILSLQRSYLFHNALIFLKHLPTDRNQHHCLENIFSFLNFDDFKRVERVSPEWKKIMMTNHRLWKNLLDQNVTLLDTDSLV